MKKMRSASELEQWRNEIRKQRDPNRACIVTSVGTCGLARGAGNVAKSISDELRQHGLADSVDVRLTGCLGFCEIEPVVILQPDGILYQHVKPTDVPEIISETIVKKNVVDRLLYTDPATGRKIVHKKELPFESKQMRLLLQSNESIVPQRIEDYIAIGGYAALAKILTGMKPEEVMEEIKTSGLRGRGGGGFPTGTKWESARHARGAMKFIICNADEGDPGAFMDRSLLEGNPHSVIEGMIIGAYAISEKGKMPAIGYVYVRNEYPLAVKNLTLALEQAREYGLLGNNILGSGFNFGIKINRGGGAFVAGESSALMASLEGNVAEPRAKYIHTVEVGAWGMPSCLNNVETWANVPLIIEKGGNHFASIGSENSKGTKIFSLVGKINNTGLVEVPMGIKLREIIYDIGGGIPNGKKFKGVQTGGPSGGVIPESLLDLPVDYDELYKAGSMMGSGGMIVMDENTCMVDVAKYFLNFLKEESCGKCVPCREGVARMHEIITDITQGKGRAGDIELLEEVAAAVSDTALCALGSTAANPVMTTLKYFRDEYEQHIKNRKCPAGVCKELITYSIKSDVCTGCGACAKVCPQEAIAGEKKQPHKVDTAKCIKCGACQEICNFDAVMVQ
jgi:NADH-quinone oxidoreductase subunit F